MTTPLTRYCSACFRDQPFDARWFALHIDSDGDLILTRPVMEGAIEYERPNTVFACGQGTALVLVERYLHCGSFELAQSLHQPPMSPEAFDQLT